jgi:hypothetical protein
MAKAIFLMKRLVYLNLAYLTLTTQPEQLLLTLTAMVLQTFLSLTPELTNRPFPADRISYFCHLQIGN